MESSAQLQQHKQDDDRMEHMYDDKVKTMDALRRLLDFNGFFDLFISVCCIGCALFSSIQRIMRFLFNDAARVFAIRKILLPLL